MITDEMAFEVIQISFNLMRTRVIRACLSEWDEHEMCLPKHVSEEFNSMWLELASWN